MRVCLVAEGCYPYAVGGVSSWAHNLIKSFPHEEFILLTIVANRDIRGKFVYELPVNVTEVYEVYLSDFDWGDSKKRNRKSHMKDSEYQALSDLVMNRNITDINWKALFTFFTQRKLSINDLLMGEDFLNVVKECYQSQYSQVAFADFLWTMRSIYLPLFLIMKTKIPKADLYHAVATGYAGVLAGMAKVLYGTKVLISEHGIYTREREEELIKAKWVEGIYKNIWIDQFKKMSLLAYEMADIVTSLYEHARELQIELGCPAEKTMITPNGIDAARFAHLPGKPPDEEKMVNIGAILRVTPIKDVKTMIQAFAFAKERIPRVKLWIMGPWEEDMDYAQECFDLVEILKIPDVMFTGRINVMEYLGRMDLTILTSISEGQPLTILESYAAKKPVIATDVGNCRGLIYGEGDDFGPAGILTHIMNVEEIAQAMVQMAESGAMRVQMGINGYNRLMSKYRIEHMQKMYNHIYQQFENNLESGRLTFAPLATGEQYTEEAEYDKDYNGDAPPPKMAANEPTDQPDNLSYRDVELKGLDVELKDSEDSLGDIDSDLKDFDGDLKDFDGDLKDFDGDLKDFDGDLKDFDDDLKDFDDELKDFDGELKDILRDPDYTGKPLELSELQEIDDLVTMDNIRFSDKKFDYDYGDYDFSDYDEPTSLRHLIGAPDLSQHPRKEKKHGRNRRNAK
jgi:glycosyltransferase involved in cell wall biosynthesis